MNPIDLISATTFIAIVVGFFAVAIIRWIFTGGEE
jgi:hypothetical protein